MMTPRFGDNKQDNNSYDNKIFFNKGIVEAPISHIMPVKQKLLSTIKPWLQNGAEEVMKLQSMIMQC